MAANKQKTNERHGTALVLFSGGQDSCTCLAWALDFHAHVETVGFYYGQMHEVELQARTRFLRKFREQFPEAASRLGEDHLVDLSGFGDIAKSALTGDVMEQRRKDGLPSTYVPGRNLVFLLAAAALADRRGADALVGGMCETDYSGYPDCRRAAIDAMETTIRLGMEMHLPIETPLMHITKAQTWDLAVELGGQELVNLIIEESHTCYKGDRVHKHAWGYGCGECDACKLRRAGYADWVASKAVSAQ